MKKIRIYKRCENRFDYIGINESLLIDTDGLTGVDRFTGFYDIEGKEIYENDIVQLVDFYGYVRKLEDNYLVVVEYGNIGVEFSYIMKKDIEYKVLGNIYTDIDLLDMVGV